MKCWSIWELQKAILSKFKCTLNSSIQNCWCVLSINSLYTIAIVLTYQYNKPKQIHVTILCSDIESPSGGCEWRELWNAYRCKALQHHMLVIESMDDDTETRRLSPLALTGGDTGNGEYTDLINGPMDHGSLAQVLKWTH